MKQYNIVITNDDEKNDFATLEYVTEDGTADSLVELVRQAVSYRGELRFSLGDRYIKIEEASDGGFLYDVYESKEAFENDEESIDGGLCTGTLSDAIEMAIN